MESKKGLSSKAKRRVAISQGRVILEMRETAKKGKGKGGGEGCCHTGNFNFGPPLCFWYSSESGVVRLLGGEAKKEPERAKKSGGRRSLKITLQGREIIPVERKEEEERLEERKETQPKASYT